MSYDAQRKLCQFPGTHLKWNISIIKIGTAVKKNFFFLSTLKEESIGISC